MSDEPKKRSRSWIAVWLNLWRAVASLLLVVYVLSFWVMRERAMATVASASLLMLLCVAFTFSLALIWFPGQVRNLICSRLGGRIASELTPLLVALAGWVLISFIPMVPGFVWGLWHR
jgi:hypothetical protein